MVNQSYGCYSADMPVYIASAGKWLATATIAAVVDEGKLSWDDPVSQWLPQLGEEKGKATLRQLLSHTSGYPTYQPKNKPRDTYQTLALSVEHLKALPMVCKPG
ncbi:MAG TPA: serine hydrolase, partial [Phycisphaerales bacterium]|nr:serine hydrolase [Phycisphaerales bacterium]